MTTATTPRATPSPWLPFRLPEGDTRLYCLPHAGGSASMFVPWSRGLDGVAVRPVEPPGRGTRFGQTPYTGISALVRDLAQTLLDEQEDGRERYAVYGHSLGALVAFELLRELRRLGAPAPAHLFVSGCLAPDDPTQDDDPPIGELSDTQVAGVLRRIGGTPEKLLRDKSAMRLILPPFRADFQVKQSYVFRPQEPLDVPITAIAATADLRVGAAAMQGWKRHTADRFELLTLAGGHFAVLEQAEATQRIIRRALAAAPVPAAVG
jgi:medium-chain acyl-[acyl-carrier-protein] hydrolase